MTYPRAPWQPRRPDDLPAPWMAVVALIFFAGRAALGIGVGVLVWSLVG